MPLNLKHKKKKSIIDLNRCKKLQTPKFTKLWKFRSVPENISSSISKNSKLRLLTKSENDELSGCIPNLKLMMWKTEDEEYLKKKSKFKIAYCEDNCEETPKFSFG